MHRTPVVAIVGRPNVGKSTLFNRLTGSRRAVVDDTPGVTRDRLYGEGEAFGRPFRVVDTSGLDSAFGDDISALAQTQAQIAIDEADVVLFMLDGQEGVTKVDHEIADLLRRGGRPIVLVANKLESLQRGQLDGVWDLRLGEALPISALHGTQVGDLIEQLHNLLPEPIEPSEEPDEDGIVKVAVVGRPNVGKSSLINAMLGEERVIVSAIAGTTRDAIDTPFERAGQPFVLIDTAGIRRKAKVTAALEYYCNLRAMDAIARCDVAICTLAALDGPTHQDKRIIGMAHEAGRGVILAVNQWDLLQVWLADRENSPHEISPELDQRLFRSTAKTVLRDYAKVLRDALPFCAYAPIIMTTAIRGVGVGKLLDEAQLIAEHHAFRVATGDLNRVIREVLDQRPPQTRHGKRLKLLYATQVRAKPPTFVLFVNDAELVHFSFERFLENQLRERYNFEGTPVRLLWRTRREDEVRRARG